MTMQTIEFKGLRVFADPDATRNSYISVPNDRGCTCAYCRNFRPQLPDVLSEDVCGLLHSLGVDPLKPSESIHSNRHEDGLNLYSVVYHFVGQLDMNRPVHEIATAKGGRDFLTDSVEMSNKRSLHFSSAYFPHHKVFDGTNHPYVEICLDGVPWVIEPLPES